jgi:colanic acid/amylovoran biosynthesis glycosyltransferase
VKKLLVFAEQMLPPGQTFIPIVVNSLRRFEAQYIGLRPVVPSAQLPAPPVLLTKDNNQRARVRREAYRITGYAPSFHQAARREAAVLMHAHFAEGAAAAVSLSRALGIPFVMHLRGGAELFSDTALRGKVFEWSYLLWRRRLWKCCSRFLCVSRFIRDKALQAGFPAEKLTIHYTGVDFSRFATVGSDVERDKNLILYAGRLVRYKGADHFIRAVHRVRQRYPKARAIIIGDGWFRAEVESLACDLSVPCRFLGDQPPSVVREYMSKARVFCAPSRTLEDGMSEAFGNVFTEAQAMGLPVVAYRHGGIVETMLEGETGLMAEENDVGGLANHIERFLSDDDCWDRCSRRAAAWVRSEFDVHSQTAKLESLYETVLDQHAREIANIA